MSLFGGHKATGTKVAPIKGLQVQTSTYGQPVPLVYGQNRVPPNLIHYKNFTAIPHTSSQSSGGKGGSHNTGTTSYTYTVACALALCQGPINSVGTIWRDKDKTTLSALGLTLFTGVAQQAAWSFLTTNYPAEAVPYSLTAYVAAPALDLGSSASLPNFNMEVTGLVPYQVGTINDAEPSAIVTDYIGRMLVAKAQGTLVTEGGSTLVTESSNPLVTEAYGSSSGTTILGSLAIFRTYCIARGLFISPLEDNQRTAAEFIKYICQICNSAPVWSNGALTILPFGDTAITGNGVTYTPNLTPVYALTYDDFLFAAGEPPVKHTRKTQSQAFNNTRIEYNNRANEYNTSIEEAKDQADIDDNGLLTAPVFKATAITTASVARDVAQIMMQRALMVRNNYEFTLGVRHCLLEPMDYLSITDAGLGLSSQLVRILSVEEKDDSITITSEEVLVGTAAAPLYPAQPTLGYTNNFNVDPGSIVAPLIMNGAGLLTATGYETWIAACGLSANSAVWGGCQVWVSDDNVTYRYAGRMLAPSRYGTIITASLPAAVGYDTADTLSIQLNATTTSQILGGTSTDVTQWRNLLYVDGEWISWKNAALVSGTSYNLTSMQRGGYGSTGASHAIGANVAVIDAAIFRLPYDQGNTGRTVYYKFLSFNIYGGGLQTLAVATAYSKVLGASATTAPGIPATAVPVALTIASGVLTIDASLGAAFTVSLTANITSVVAKNWPASYACSLQLTQDATGGRTMVVGAPITYAASPAYVPSAGAGAVDMLTLASLNSGGNVLLTVVTKGSGAGAFSATYSPSSYSQSVLWTSGAAISVSQQYTITTAGQTGTVSYLWTVVSGSGISISATNVNNPTFTSTASKGGEWYETYNCKITDGGSGSVINMSFPLDFAVTNTL